MKSKVLSLSITIATVMTSPQVRLVERIEMDVTDVELKGVYTFEDLQSAVVITEPNVEF